MKTRNQVFSSLLGLLFSGVAVAAEGVTTRIVEVMEPKAGETVLRALSSEDGRIYRVSLDGAKAGIAGSVRAAAAEGKWVRLEADALREVQSIEAVAAPAAQAAVEAEADGIDKLRDSYGTHNSSYQPTSLSSMSEAQRLYDSLDTGMRRRSQCYQRAHLWAYSMYSARNIRSIKIFLFYTQEYIRNIDDEWWFHVTPAVYVGDEVITLDPTFTPGPLTLRNWSNSFVDSHRECPVIDQYSDYSQHQYGQHCYLRPVPMYYMQPMDIERADSSGVAITHWRSSDLELAQGARGRRGRR